MCLANDFGCLGLVLSQCANRVPFRLSDAVEPRVRESPRTLRLRRHGVCIEPRGVRGRRARVRGWRRRCRRLSIRRGRGGVRRRTWPGRRRRIRFRRDGRRWGWRRGRWRCGRGGKRGWAGAGRVQLRRVVPLSSRQRRRPKGDLQPLRAARRPGVDRLAIRGGKLGREDVVVRAGAQGGDGLVGVDRRRVGRRLLGRRKRCRGSMHDESEFSGTTDGAAPSESARKAMNGPFTTRRSRRAWGGPRHAPDEPSRAPTGLVAPVTALGP